MKPVVCIFFLIGLSFISCDRFSKTAKDAVNKTGEKVGETATEFFEGVAEGVDKTLECELVLSEELKDMGIQTGTFSVSKNASNSDNNKLTVYLIFEKDFDGEFFVKAFDKKDLEIGRTKKSISGKAQEAGYFDFTFDQRTDIGVRNKITIE